MIAAGTPWSDAAIAIAGILFVLAIAVAVISRSRPRPARGCRSSARALTASSPTTHVAAQHRTADQLERAVAELTELRTRTGEMERVLKEVG